MKITMGTPEYIMVFLIALSIWVKAVNITNQKSNTETIGAAFGLLVYITAWPYLLYWGGFFD